ncbi:DUF1588 domain-containing protein [Steroidobacter agaridevorans]|uniref:DUF1588 domain-containing protein n=1 Tax=Steroidobacter agaridevorans TaxID=2695856 RepID=UPI00132A895A|nr:DUF1588 domain-containing protein [Steroidobacter agaridevorans]GFE89864.1 hypothetical protein GCM10011488_48180 [Steroidobacter agaridevorans]
MRLRLSERCPRLLASAAALLATIALGSYSETSIASQGAATSHQTQAPLQEPQDTGSLNRLRLLSEEQYLNTVRYVFGPDVAPEPHFPPAQRRDGLLALGSSITGVTTAQLELYQKAAVTIANTVVDPKYRAFLITCKPRNEKKADKACASQFLKEKGRLLNRRPLTRNELDAFVAEANKTADQLKDFYVGIGVALEAMLVSPNVLFVAEATEPDPARPGRQRLDAFSLATRMSLFLWNAAPDDNVLKAAESGEIQTPEGRARVVDMMLSSRRLDAGVRAFFDDMFGFDDFNSLSKDPATYPQFTGQVAQDAREQTLRTIVDHLVNKRGDYRDLFTTRETFISPALAVLYGEPAPAGWTPYTDPPDSPRAGLLSQVSFLALHSHPTRSSPTLRGKALRETLLCQRVPPPPPNVDFSAVDNPDSPFATQRERVAFHLKNPVCAGCHKITDPMGLALENFDSSGRFREEERGSKIDASGTLDGKSFSGVVSLGKVLHDNPGLTSCLVQRIYSYGAGGAVRPEDKKTLEYFNARFAEAGYRVPDLLRTIALSNAFSEIVAPKSPAPAVTTASATN